MKLIIPSVKLELVNSERVQLAKPLSGLQLPEDIDKVKVVLNCDVDKVAREVLVERQHKIEQSRKDFAHRS